MCFSAEASFAAGAFLVSVGTLTLRSASSPRELPFAAIPLLFAIQQLSEGVIWQTFDYEAPLLNAVMTNFYSFFSHVLWPVYVPVAVLLIEPPGLRRRALYAFVVAGVAVAAYLLYFLVGVTIVSRPVGQHIEYVSPHFFATTAITLYVMSTTFSPLLSTHRTVRLFGVLALLSFAAAYYFYANWFISVWCFFAALLSVVFYLHFVVRRTEHGGTRDTLGATVFAHSTANAIPGRQAAAASMINALNIAKAYIVGGIASLSAALRQIRDAGVRARNIPKIAGGVTIGLSASTGVPLNTIVVLMLAVFTVSMAFGVTLPLLPYLIERLLGATGDAAQVSRSTGFLTALYMLSLFIFAPAWGHMSDRYGRRTVLLIGLSGFSATMLTFAFIENLSALYVERFLSGLFAAAVTPVALAAIGDLAATEEERARRLTFVSLAGISGFLLGPMLGVLVAQGAADVVPNVGAAGSLTVPLAGTAFLALLVAVAAAMTVPVSKRGDVAPQRDRPASAPPAWLVPKLLSLSFIVAAGVGVFEVGLALRGKQELGLTQNQIALMFTECSLVMLVVQAIVFSPWVRPETTRWFIAPALAVLATGLFLLPYAFNFTLMLLVIAAVAASAGILSPILTYWISSKAGWAQGAELGKQTAAASLGAAVGSAAGGLLFDLTWLPNAPFLLMTVLTLLGVFLSLGLPISLVRHTLGERAQEVPRPLRSTAISPPTSEVIATSRVVRDLGANPS